VRGNGMNNKKICFAASSGGHFEQLMMLRPMMDKYSSVVVTEKTKYGTSIKDIKTYYMMQVNRKEILCPLKIIINAFNSLKILLIENPDAIICTGVLAMIPLCLIGKLWGKKLIYIESFAKITSPTQSGKFLYKYADQFYIQWPQMKEFYPEAIYLGGIY
jgi:beta-1,4-N-acetylglucosaminyltransferase